MEKMEQLTAGNPPAYIDERKVVTIKSYSIGRMKKVQIEKWLKANKIPSWKIKFWKTNRILPGIEIVFKRIEDAKERREEGVRVGEDKNYPICNMGLKTRVVARCQSGKLQIGRVTELIKKYGEILHTETMDCEQMRFIMILKEDIPRDLPNYKVFYRGQPMECHLCKGSHNMKECTKKCQCGKGKAHIKERCRKTKTHMDMQEENTEEEDFGVGEGDALAYEDYTKQDKEQMGETSGIREIEIEMEEL